MIGVFLKLGFLAREFLEVSPGALCATFLQALPKRMMTLPCFLNSLAAKGLTLTIGSQIDNAEINTEDVSHFIGRGFRDIKRHCQVEDPLAIEQVRLSLDRLQSGLLIVANAEGYEYPPGECYEGDLIKPFESHHTRIVDHGHISA